MKELLEQGIEYLRMELKDFIRNEDEVSYEEESDVVSIWSHIDQSAIELEPEEFLEYVSECKKIKIDTNKGVVITPHHYLQLVSPENNPAILHRTLIAITTENNITISTCYEDFLVAFAAMKTNTYAEYVQTPLSYIAIEVLDLSGKTTPQEAAQLIDVFLFELADTHNIIFSKTIFIDPEDFDISDFDEYEKPLSFKPLEKYNDGIRLYSAAVQVADPELKLISLYKVFEFYAPIVFNLELTEALRKKFDSPKSLSPDGEYLSSIIDLVRNHDSLKKDKEMIKALFVRCLDIVDLAQLLPSSFQQNITYESKKTDIDKYNISIAETLVATRNYLAHAKSNYKLVGNECKNEDLIQFNIFLKAAAGKLIRWSNRLPDHQKLFG